RTRLGRARPDRIAKRGISLGNNFLLAQVYHGDNQISRFENRPITKSPDLQASVVNHSARYSKRSRPVSSFFIGIIFLRTGSRSRGRSGWIQNESWNLLLLHNLIERGQIALDHLLPFAHLFIAALLQHVENFIGLRSGSRIGRRYRAPKCHQFIVEADGVVEHVLSALGLGLDQRVLDRLKFLLQLLAGVAHGCAMIVLWQPLIEIIELLLYAVHLVYSRIHFADLFADLHEQIELLL